MAMEGRILPHDLEAEKSVLGGMLISETAVEKAFELLKADDFYSSVNQEIYTAMEALRADSSAIDLVTLVSELSRRKTVDGVGGIQYITDLPAGVPSIANIGHYINIVLEKSKLRKLIRVSSDVSNESYSGEKKVDEILNIAEKGIFDIALNNSRSTLEAIANILGPTMDRVEELHRRKGQMVGVPTGFPELDYMLAGLQPSSLIIVAARPSMGKTSFALNVAQNAALRYDKNVAIFSLEMSKTELTSRLLCSEAMVDMENIRHGKLSDKDMKKMIDAMTLFSQSGIYIDETPAITVPEIRSKCRRLLVEQKKLDLIVIDYLTLMGTAGKSESYQQEIALLSRSLKGLARELSAPVIVISQLSRASEKRTDHRPVLSDLRDSGAIEQDADVVLFIHREGYYQDKGEEDDGSAEVIIAKQRNGPVGKVNLLWRGEFTRFMPITNREAPGGGGAPKGDAPFE